MDKAQITTTMYMHLLQYCAKVPTGTLVMDRVVLPILGKDVK